MTASTAKPTIVCVDDEQIVLTSLKRQLRRHFGADFMIEVVDSAEEALEVIEDLLAAEVDVPVVISDQIMPGMKGHELLGEVRNLSPRSLTILLTGQASVEDVGKALNTAQLYRYLSKPWSETDLLLTCREATNSYFQDKQLAAQHLELIAVNARLKAANEDLERKAGAFHRFVPRQFIDALDTGRGYDDVRSGDCVEREMTVLFSDIRGFTSLSEGCTPDENFCFINDYLQHMEPAIRSNGGFIDKFIGDAIMALFETADQAHAGALDMLEMLRNYNEERAAAGKVTIRIGVGLNTGPLMMGIVGADDRVEGTVIGHAVNTASRLEGVTKEYDTPLVMSATTRDALSPGPQDTVRLIDLTTLRGHSGPQPIYESLAHLQEDRRVALLASRNDFETGVLCFHAGEVAQALSCFQRCVDAVPDDSLARLRRDRCTASLGPQADS